jgi:dihydroorotate dehydrogenase (NAD+) catalytic subunit
MTKDNSNVNQYRNLLHPGFSSPLPKWTYDITKSYDWNYENGPKFSGKFPSRRVRPNKKFLAFEVNSLFGVPAGPLVNSSWIALYAKLGFDILTYKTVRSRPYPAFPTPHMLYVEPNEDKKYTGRPYKVEDERLAMTNSFGVPSRDPDLWQEDIQKSLKALSKGQLLIVGTMGTVEAAKNEEDYIKDFAYTALLAKEAGAPIIEVNLSCPNLASEGVVCFDVTLSAKICEAIKNAIGDTPLIAKIGYFEDDNMLEKFVEKTYKYVASYASINTVRGEIVDKQFKKLHMRNIAQSGLCGEYIRPFGLSQVEKLKKLRDVKGHKYAIIGMGGITIPEDYELYITAGADVVQSGTGAMMDPYLAYKIYQKESEQKTEYNLSKSFGAHHFDTITKLHSLDQLKKMYMEFVFDKKGKPEEQILRIEKEPFKLKHGERGRKTSHVYLNHRQKLLSDPWDRKLMAKIADLLIREKVAGAKKGYGIIATTTSSSPEVTAQILHDHPDDVSRAVIVTDEILSKEKGAHTPMYGRIDKTKPWIVFDDVFTSGNTFKQTLRFLQSNKIPTENIFFVVLTIRGEENIPGFTKETKKTPLSLTTFNEILQYHWSQFTPSQQKFILSERPEVKNKTDGQ